MRFEISQSCDDGRWCWYLMGASNAVIARSVSYPTKAAAFSDIRQILGARDVPVYERMPEEEEAPRQLGAARPVGAKGNRSRALVDAAS